MLLATSLMALGAAATFATSTILQQSRARSVAVNSGSHSGRLGWMPVLGILGPIIRDPVWQAGWLVNAVGFCLQTIALHVGSIAVVQSILAVQLVIVMVIGGARRHLRPTALDYLAAVSVCSGVILFVVMRAHAGQRHAAPTHTFTYLVVSAVVVVALMAVARTGREGDSLRGAVIGLAAGGCFTGTAVLLTVLTGALSTDGPLGLVGWQLPVLVICTVTGSLLVQEAFSSGPLPAPLTAMTVADPVLSAIAGAVLFDADRPGPLELAVGLPIAGALIAVGVLLLARSPTLSVELGQAALSDRTSDECNSRNRSTVADHG